MKKAFRFVTYILIFSIVVSLIATNDRAISAFCKQHNTTSTEIASTHLPFDLYILPSHSKATKPSFKPIHSDNIIYFGIQINYASVYSEIHYTMLIPDLREKIRSLLTKRFYGGNYTKVALSI